jgi:hypothetical protein
MPRLMARMFPPSSFGQRASSSTRTRETPEPFTRSYSLVPKLCLGIRMSRKLCFLPGSETEFRKPSAFPTELGNEEVKAALGLKTRRVLDCDFAAHSLDR